MATEKKLLSVRETADVLGVSVRSLWRAIREGRVPVIRVGPRLPRIDIEALLEALKEER